MLLKDENYLDIQRKFMINHTYNRLITLLFTKMVYYLKVLSIDINLCT